MLVSVKGASLGLAGVGASAPDRPAEAGSVLLQAHPARAVPPVPSGDAEACHHPRQTSIKALMRLGLISHEPWSPMTL